MSYSTLGRHIALDAWGVSFDLLDDLDDLQSILEFAASNCGAEVLSIQSKKFEPYGVTILVLLSESHVSIHTYPEKGFAAIDCFTCGVADPQIAIDYIISELQPERFYYKRLWRGTDSIIESY